MVVRRERSAVAVVGLAALRTCEARWFVHDLDPLDLRCVVERRRTAHYSYILQHLVLRLSDGVSA